MTIKKYRMRYFVRDGEFKGMSGSRSEFPEVEKYFKDTIDAFTEEARKEQKANPSRRYIGRLEITIEEN